MRDALLAQREILRRLPLDYTVSEAQALELYKALCGALPRKNSGHWTAPGPWTGGSWKGKIYITPLPRPCWLPTRSWQPVRSTRPCSTPAGSGMSRSTSRWCTSAVSADITLETSIGATRPLPLPLRLQSSGAAAPCTSGCGCRSRRPARHRAASRWIPSPSRRPTHCTGRCCPAHGVLGRLTLPGTAFWRGVQLPARYADPLHMQADPVQPDFDTQELPHLEFTPYLRALAAPAHPRGSPTRCRRQSAFTTM